MRPRRHRSPGPEGSLLTASIKRRPGWTELGALYNGKRHVVWRQFYNSPHNFVVLQQFAKWFYAEEFADMDPIANFSEFHDRFLPIDYAGAFFVTAARRDDLSQPTFPTGRAPCTMRSSLPKRVV